MEGRRGGPGAVRAVTDTRRIGWRQGRAAAWAALALAGLCAAAPPRGPANTPGATLTPADNAMISFAGNASPTKIYEVAGLWLTLSSGAEREGVYHAVMNIRGPGASVFTDLGGPNTDGSAKFGVFRLDSGVKTPQIVFTSFTGGAHCCVRVDILSYDGLRWRRIEAGASNGGLLSLYEKHGDAAPALVFGDDRFVYAFASYAESRQPIRVFSFRAGRLIDVSEAWTYKPLYLAEMGKLRGDCEQHANGACAAFVADAARAGRFKEAWATMLASYDKSSQVFPTSCDVAEVQGACPDGRAHKFSSYPQALARFLADTGYRPRS